MESQIAADFIPSKDVILSRRKPAKDLARSGSTLQSRRDEAITRR